MNEQPSHIEPLNAIQLNELQSLHPTRWIQSQELCRLVSLQLPALLNMANQTLEDRTAITHLVELVKRLEKAQTAKEEIVGVTPAELAHIRKVVDHSKTENIFCSSAFGRIDGVVVKKMVARLVEDMKTNSSGFTRLEQARMDYARLAEENTMQRKAVDGAINALERQQLLLADLISKQTAGATSAPANQGGQAV